MNKKMTNTLAQGDQTPVVLQGANSSELSLQMNTENNKVLKQEECSSVCKASTVLGVEMTVEYLKKQGMLLMVN